MGLPHDTSADTEATNPGEITAPTAPNPSSKKPNSSSMGLRTFPVQGWDRYEVLSFLGAGGMGRVFKARDPRLNRFVALKLIRGDEPELVSRLMREARAQAQVDHEYVCKVYEVGEAEGHPYIAMQYVEGSSLREARGEMTLEQKVEVIRKVACGLHAAHRLGLVHRDVKPANIMLERDEEGGFNPYVMDFGLARETQASSDGASTGAAVEGTPAYMAPEQARGERSHLDRRTDVYSLGATLYEILAGRAPFVGTSSIDILLALVSEEPAPIREFYSGVPADLETIVMKCLEKEAGKRYDSAKALADDLRRYLDGEPVLARRTGLAYRLLKRAKKHKALVALAASALVSITLLGGAWIRARLSAAEQARVSQQLGRDVSEMETTMELAYSRPLHDTRREKEALHARMAEIERRIGKVAAIGDGPARYALGRGHLALHEYEEAVTELSAAYSAGYRGSEVALSLGQALEGAYRSALREADRVEDADRRKEKIKQAEARYLEPALHYLRESGGSGGASRAYIEGLIALYEKRYEEALKKATEAFEGSPWLYEAKKLEAFVHFVEGGEARRRGDYEGALKSYKPALDALRVAEDIARSDADLYDLETDIWIDCIEAEIKRGASAQASLDAALTALEHSLVASPARSGPYSKKALALFRVAEYQTSIHEDPTRNLNKGMEAADEAIQRNRSDAEALASMANLQFVRARYEENMGRDPRDWLEHSAESARGALRLNPNYAWEWNDLGMVYQRVAAFEVAHGIDPAIAVQRGVDMFNQAIRVDPTYNYPPGNACFTISFQSQNELNRGKDPRPSLLRASTACEQGLKIAPGIHWIHTNVSLVHLLRAQYERDLGLDPRPSADRAVESAATAVKLNHDDVEAERYAAAAHHVKALYALESGDDPSEALRRAREHLDASVAIAPSEPLAARLRGAVELTEARWQIRNGKDPKEALNRARSALDLSLKSNANDAETFQAIADLHRVQAERAKAKSKELDAALTEGLSAADASLAINPRLASAIEARGALYLAKASKEPPGEARKEAATKALASLDEALHENANIERELRPLLSAAKELADGTSTRRSP